MKTLCTCPTCGTTGFTQRGLKAHRCDGHNRNPKTSTITWIEAAKELPDDEKTVLVALDAGEVCAGEVWTGFRDAGDWRYVDAELIQSPVRYWAEFPAHPNDCP